MYLVTGGCGFIGSHLTEALLASAHRVRVLDDLSTGRLDNLAAGAELVRGDVRDPRVLAEAFDGVDGCYHLAAIASVERCHRDWQGSHAVNLGGTINVFEAACRTRRRERSVPVVYASSAVVYGEPDVTPTDETAAPAPLSAYGVDKLACEMHARVAATVHGLATTGLRLFNVYGRRQDPSSPYSGVVSVFCDRIATGREIEIHGDGEQVRDFVHVRDVVAAHAAAMTRLERMPEAGADVVNVCSGVPTAIRDLAMLVGDIVGAPVKARHVPGRVGDIRRSLGNPDRAGRLLGVVGATALAAGLEDVARGGR